MTNSPTAFTAVFVLLAAHVAIGVTVASAADLPANLVTNPSLEETVPADGLPPGWGKFYSNPTGVYRASITDGGRTGKKEMRIDCVERKKGEAQFGAMPANRVLLDATKRYVARGWVKVAGGKRATADVKLHYYDTGGAYLGQTRIGFASPGNDAWQLVTVTDHAAEFPQARFIGLAIACTGDAKAQYDDLELLAFDKDKLPADFDDTYGVTLSPQLAVLSRRVGTWETRTKIKPCLWVPQGIESTGIETIRWSLGGQLLEGRQKSPESGIEQLSLITYDARDQVYRSWFFRSNGDLPRCQTVGQWDKTTETLTFKNEPKDEFDSVVQMKFIGNDMVRWQGIWKDKVGQVLLDAEGTSKRGVPDRSPPKSVAVTTERTEFPSSSSTQSSTKPTEVAVEDRIYGLQDAAKAGQSSTRLPKVAVERPVVNMVVDYATFQGRAEASNSVDIQPQIAGYLAKRCFESGQLVKKGELLFEIDPRSYEAEFRKWQAEVSTSQAKLDRVNASLKRTMKGAEGASVRVDLERIQAEKADTESAVKRGRANLDLASLQLESTKIRAPIDGIAGIPSLDVGKQVTANSPALTTIVSTDPMLVDFDIDEHAMLRLQRKARESRAAEFAGAVDVGLADESGYSRQAVIIATGNKFDPVKRTLRIRASLPNPDRRIVPGMSLRVRLALSEPHKATNAPEAAPRSAAGP